MAFPTPANFREWLSLATVDITPLRRHRDFRLNFVGRSVSAFGSMITFVAVPYQVYLLTRSSALVGLLGVVELAALLGFALLGGALADARDRRMIGLLAEAGLMVTSIVLLGNALLSQPYTWLVFAMVSMQAGLDAMQTPSMAALVPRLVERDEIPAALALNGIRSTTAMIAGPALAGVVIAIAGLPVAYAIDVGTFVVGLACLWLMRAVPPPVDAARPSVRRILEGLRYARSRSELMGTYIVDIIAMFFGMPIALFPAIATGLGGPKVLGLLYAAIAVGSFLFSATSGWTKRVRRHGLAVIVAATLWGFAIIAFGFAQSLPVALLCLVAGGAADMMSGIFRQTLWNQTIPDSLRGRLASIEQISYSGGPLLGNFRAGLLGSVVSIRFSIVSGGVMCVAACLIAAIVLPGLRTYDAQKWQAATLKP